MRIIAGKLKGKKLTSLTGTFIRPTADRVREAIFNICAFQIADSVVLDLFAGTGAFSIESLSRGARSAVLIDSSIQAVSIIEKNIIACRLKDQAKILLYIFISSLTPAFLRLNKMLHRYLPRVNANNCRENKNAYNRPLCFL